MKRALISGINGFAASWLAEELLQQGWQVSGTVRPRSNKANVEHIWDKIETYICEITDFFSVSGAIGKASPDVVFHLAAQSFVPLSWQAPHLTFETNVGGTINVLEACRASGRNPVILITSSSQIYGNAEPPFGLETLPDPVNPYDVSKLAQELIGLSYWKSYGERVRVTRAFNITGPRRQEFMAESSFAKQLVECEKGLRDEIKIGNLDATRDFVDVRDIAKAYVKVATEGEDGKRYILASGQERSMHSVLDTLLKLSLAKPKVITDPNLLRPSDTPRMAGIPTQDIEWKPTIPFEQSMDDLLSYWRSKL